MQAGLVVGRLGEVKGAVGVMPGRFERFWGVVRCLQGGGGGAVRVVVSRLSGGSVGVGSRISRG